MSEIVGRVVEAIEEAPQPFVRRNKTLSGPQYEVVVADKREPISEETQRIVGVYAEAEEARAVAETLAEEMRARAAIAAMREPTEAMVDAGVEAEYPAGGLGADQVAAVLDGGWRAMIDAALKP